MIYTGYIDSEREPIKVDDYMATPSESRAGIVVEESGKFFLRYGDTYDWLSAVANKYHIISEKEADDIFGDYYS